ncbi:hypothetical protein [Mycolicibacterium chitae]|uniref:hypothetical protein n=1 Tax=Mycolicibacterium chitae TaxID=1792 RepID=UPI000F83DEB6|nr:hypothetical protein [Mycolicibacterium chitae]MCV7106906.1 hypothetical protein [Mycolicibacterium chitae]
MKRQTPGILLKVGVGMIVAAGVAFLASLQFEAGWLPWLAVVLLLNGLADITAGRWMKRRQPAAS